MTVKKYKKNLNITEVTWAVQSVSKGTLGKAKDAAVAAQCQEDFGFNRELPILAYMDWTLHLRDNYEFQNAHLWAGLVYDDWMWALNKYGWAQDFKITGSITVRLGGRSTLQNTSWLLSFRTSAFSVRRWKNKVIGRVPYIVCRGSGSGMGNCG